MAFDAADMPSYVKDFLFYQEIVKGRSPRTVEAYYIDLRTFLRFLKSKNNLVAKSTEFGEIQITDTPIELIQKVTLTDVHEFLHFLNRERGNSAKTRARKATVLRVFFKYLNTKTTLLPENPITELELPSQKKSLPKFLTLEQSIELLNTVESSTPERDYCILTFFLNCGMRLSELVGINLNDISGNTLRVLGKGNKERIIYLNDACLAAFNACKDKRPDIKSTTALFVSRNGNRISRRRVQEIVELALKRAGLENAGLSVHKLRHTAATLMYQHGGVDIRVLKEILGHENLATTEIYTHVSSQQIESAVSKSPLSKITQKKRKKEKE